MVKRGDGYGATGFSGSAAPNSNVVKLITVPICPDLLEHRYLGEADNARGRVVRAFFWLMRFWPVDA